MPLVAATVVPVAFGAFSLFFARTKGLREALLCAALAFGVVVVVLTESLGCAGLLRPSAVFLSWLVVAAISSCFARRPSELGTLRKEAVRAIWEHRLEATLIAVIVGIFGMVALTALASAPNSADAMTYHLPRVIYWMQQGSVDNFPTHYLNQLMLQPLAEYFSLHGFLLAGSDRFTNLVQLFGFVLSVIGVSLIARELGAGIRGQTVAAFFCATLPNAVLQASGAKNDLLLSAWLVASVFFALRWAKSDKVWDLVALAVAVALAFLTKGTAYIFLPALLCGVFIACGSVGRIRLVRAAPLCLVAVVTLNGPFYIRNIGLSGSPLGFDSAHGDGLFRWQNETINLRNTTSNLLRHLSEQLGTRSDVANRRIYDVVLAAHAWIGADANDPATTWRWTQYDPPRNPNHEASANNRRHLMLLVLLAFAVAFGFVARRDATLFWLGTGLAMGLLIFCAYLKWQPYQSRLLLPLFVAASPLVGRCLGKIPSLFAVLICWFLIDGSRLAVTQNWTRPLVGPSSVLDTPRPEEYFADLTPWDNKRSHLEAVDRVAQSHCENVGIDSTYYEIEYPFQALLLQRNPRVRFFHVGVANPSLRYEPTPPNVRCAVLCMDCVNAPEKLELYRDIGEPFTSGKFLVFSRLH